MALINGSVLHAARICKNFYLSIAQRPLRASVHSVYDSAVNLSAREGMVTLLDEFRKLQPYSAVLSADDFELLKSRGVQAGAVHLFYREKQNAMNGSVPSDIFVAVSNRSQIVDLTVPCFAASADAERIRRFLELRGDDYGVSALAYQQTPNAFCRFLLPRLNEFRAAARRGDVKASSEAAMNMAGCGAGLTPSSDDLISGYIAAMCASGASRELVSSIARSAAEKTNEISANLLKRAGEGLACEPVLSLLSAIFGPLRECTDDLISEVAKLGGSSGLDLLAGICLGATDAASQWRNEIDQA